MQYNLCKYVDHLEKMQVIRCLNNYSWTPLQDFWKQNLTYQWRLT